MRLLNRMQTWPRKIALDLVLARAQDLFPVLSLAFDVSLAVGPLVFYEDFAPLSSWAWWLALLCTSHGEAVPGIPFQSHPFGF